MQSSAEKVDNTDENFAEAGEVDDDVLLIAVAVVITQQVVAATARTLIQVPV